MPPLGTNRTASKMHKLDLLCPHGTYEEFTTAIYTRKQKIGYTYSTHMIIPARIANKLKLNNKTVVRCVMAVDRYPEEKEWLEDEKRRAERKLRELDLQSKNIQDTDEITSSLKEVDLPKNSLPPGIEV